MNVKERMTWFKANFGSEITEKVNDGPISVDLISAIALQETGYLWTSLLRRHDGDLEKVLEGCVGDTIDYPSRRAFPRNRETLEAEEYGAAMFVIGRDALAGLAEINGNYRRVFERDASRFCRGYGILQYDLQHIRSDPDFFLQKQWVHFEKCLEKCLNELDFSLRKRGYQDKQQLTNFEAATVAIVYNRGRYDPARQLRQGHRDSSGKYYGEYIFEYIELAQSIRTGGIAIGETVEDEVPFNYIVNARNGLNLRGGPGTDFEILETLDLGAEINVLSFMGRQDAWALVDINGDGRISGCMFTHFLEPISDNEVLFDPTEDAARAELLGILPNTPPDSGDGDECEDC